MVLIRPDVNHEETDSLSGEKPSSYLDPDRAAERALQHVAALASGDALDPGLKITINFHPDQMTPEPSSRSTLSLLEQMAQTGQYYSQFFTGTSNGGLTAYPGGDRYLWESRIFGGAYDMSPTHSRPVYGALDFRRQGVGAAPRFGSAHLRLRPSVLTRATFCYPDSAANPIHFGTTSRCNLIALAVADERDPTRRRDHLDDYIEAHIHGSIRFDRDVEALVLDPCYRNTAVEAAARLLPCSVEWHLGFHLNVTELRRHPEFRGPEFVALGSKIAQDGLLTPRILGDAAASGRYDSQSLKRVWHYLARYGAPSTLQW